MNGTRGVVLGLSVGLFALACATPRGPEFWGPPPMDFPEPDAVDAVVFLIGDAGDADRLTSPVLYPMKRDIERWSAELARDTSVTVLFLGDNVYPVGVRDRSHPEFGRDSARLYSQIDLLAGPAARARGSAGIFLAGNHDWGSTVGERGLQRVRNQRDLVDSARAKGIPVWLLPEPGDPGPATRDVRENARLLLLDTHWFLQEPDEEIRANVFTRIFRAMEEAGDRHVIMAGHHPYESAGPHGLLAPGARALGLLYLMRKSGTLVQDLNSPIYSDFLEGLHATFRDVGHPPLIFAAGHDHSLQVMDSRRPDGPRTVLVSGAGSKLTDLASSPLLRYAAARPGYMTLIFRRDGAVDLYVQALDDETPLTCPLEPEGERVACLEEAAIAMDLVYAERLAPAASPGGPS